MPIGPSTWSAPKWIASAAAALATAGTMVFTYQARTPPEALVVQPLPVIDGPVELPPEDRDAERWPETPAGSGLSGAVTAPVQKVAVAVAGAVHAPGLYELSEGARVQDLLDAAGGVGEGADLSDINVAARLIDGSTLTIPTGMSAEIGAGRISLRGQGSAVPNPLEYTRSGWAAGHAGGISGAAGTAGQSGLALDSVPAGGESGLLDLNQAGEGELETLPGIGPVTARKIIEYRGQNPFRSVDDLERVSGIGPKKMAALRSLVTVR